jgi:hypothetical protein
MDPDAIASVVNLLPISDELKSLVCEAVVLVLAQAEVFRAEERRLIADYPKVRGQGRDERLCDAVEKAAALAIIDAPDPVAHARRLVLVAVLGLYPGELPVRGEFGGWPWRSKGYLLGIILRRHSYSAADYVPGREMALFSRIITDDGSLAVDGWTKHTLEQLTRQLRQAVPLVRQNAPAAEGPEEPAKPLTKDDRQLAEHFESKYGLTPSRLRGARRDGRLSGAEKRGGRWYYSIAEVRRLWPDVFDESD